ncbi:hypothetical protein PYH37_000457 [Sinorhizobium numidicum]|uniref:Uncharacterized protein n=1 Tax=Sinorhizobium numidicum TaxID=680248 RepID=A0ABY8CR37_9HYPH|nr:hypothetical protein [Sinorhizobium numidicum]WEX75114.1 hypothetical protein PYH37_000457 [Sinorhizobium numidicum]WEX81108.1 hypothetical protein PYH38_000459 [Sinorhizobium numidicum]
MDDRDTESASHTKPASDLLGIAAQLAALAEDIKVLATVPVEQPISIEPDVKPEASSE